MFEKTTVFYAADETAAASAAEATTAAFDYPGAFEGPGDSSLSDYLAEVETAKAEDASTAQATKLSDDAENYLAAKAEGRLDDAKAEGDEKPVTEAKAEQVDDTKPVEAKTEAVPEISQAQIDALQAACDALGITETDPAKQAEAIVAARADITARREQAKQEAETQRLAQAENSWKQSATEATDKVIEDRLRAQGWDIDAKDRWNPATWANTDDPDYGAKMAAAWNAEARDPAIASFFQSQYESAKAVYDGIQAKFTEMGTKYEHHDRNLAEFMRDNGVSPQLMEDVARSTHEHTQRAIATVNSALAAAQAELTQLRAQVSGYEKAVADARAAGVTEGRNAVTQEIAEGRALPNTVGLGGTSQAATGARSVFENPGEFNFEDARAMIADAYVGRR